MVGRSIQLSSQPGHPSFLGLFAALTAGHLATSLAAGLAASLASLDAFVRLVGVACFSSSRATARVDAARNGHQYDNATNGGAHNQWHVVGGAAIEQGTLLEGGILLVLFEVLGNAWTGREIGD